MPDPNPIGDEELIADPVIRERLIRARDTYARRTSGPSEADVRTMKPAEYAAHRDATVAAANAAARQRPPMPEALRGKHVSAMTHDELRAFARSVGLTPTDISSLRRY